MSSVFDGDDKDIPFFDVVVRPVAKMDFSPYTSESHVPGRHLNGLLNAEYAAGITIDEDAIAKHTRAAFLSFSGPVCLPLNRTHRGGSLLNFVDHNVREGFHALYPLVKFRGSERARHIAETCIEEIFKLWDPKSGWNEDHIKRHYGVDIRVNEYYIQGIARSIGPLVKYYRATGYGKALDLAYVLSEKAISEYFRDDGSYDPELFGFHTHSTTCVMSGLAQFADLTSSSLIMSRVKAFFDKGLWEIRDEIGWVIENAKPGSDPDRGEVNNSGDILETALILGRWGHPEYYGDAERILRTHILPSQLRDISFIDDQSNLDGTDGTRDVANRLHGSFGFPAPYGHEPLDAPRIKFNTDIVGGTVGSLCEAIKESTRRDAAGNWINLLFDHETDQVGVESPYTHPKLRIRVKRKGPLYVRIPGWVPTDKIKVIGSSCQVRFYNGYVFIADPPVNRWLTIDYPVIDNEITLHHRTKEIRVRMRGDAVLAMDNFNTDLTYFDQI